MAVAMGVPSLVPGQDKEGSPDASTRSDQHADPRHDGVDTSTLKGKVMCGYQGWFAAEGDGSGLGWVHYAGGRKAPEPGHCTFDLWPDMSEMKDDEKFATAFRHANGDTAYLFSPYKQDTVIRHFQWMKEYGIDGVFLQRFGASLKSPGHLNHRDVVTANVRTGANRYGRTWAIMYDLSGLRAEEIETVVMEDWKRLVGRMNVTQDKAYLHHRGKPVVAIWGVGFNDHRDYTLAECGKLVEFLKRDARYGGNTVMLGVPAYWRSLSRDAVHDRELHRIIAMADIVSPWTVGRYKSPQEAEQHAESVVREDIAWTKEKGLDYLPVAFPGFSWRNLMKTRGRDATLGAIPRLKGEFLWSQVVAFRRAGAEMLYVAMFDEIDEGTAVFKCTNAPPVDGSHFLTYEGLPSDHYLWLAGRAGELLHRAVKPTEKMPSRIASQAASETKDRAP